MQNHFARYSFLLPLFCNFAVQSYEENTDSMLQDEITHQILQVFRFAPTSDQRQALDTFARFLLDRDEQSVMILRGSAGTGKTALASAMVQTLRHLGQKVVLMAPTGRAAMVFRSMPDCPHGLSTAASIASGRLQDQRDSSTSMPTSPATHSSSSMKPR